MNNYTPPDRSTSVPVSTAEPCTAEAADFLEAVAGGLPIAVAAIPPDGGSPHGATFTLPAQRDELAVWIREREGKLNLYYSLNAPASDRPRIGKAGRLAEGDVSHIRGIALDLDPGNGPLEEERACLFAKAEQAAADGGEHGAPSYVIDSGGGVQMLWLFAGPIPAVPETAATVKAQARGMGARYGSDAVQSLDHLFRLPFTRNLPNAKKRSKGRTTATAAVWRRSGGRHTLEGLRCFTEPVTAPARSVDPKSAIELDYGEVRAAVDDPASLSAGLQAIHSAMIVRAPEILEETNGDRSDADYRVAAELIRKHSVVDPTALACLTFALSPDRFADEEGRGRGEWYCNKTIAAALERNWPAPRPEDYFHPETPEEAAKADEVIAASAPKRKKRQLRFLSRDEIRNTRPPAMLIGRHLPAGSFGFLYGPPGSYKSFIALDWAMHIAYGRTDWHGDRISAPDDGHVVYLACEGSAGIKARLAAWERKHMPSVTSPCNFHLMPDTINLLLKEDVSAIIEGIEGLGVKRVAMIVVDTVSRSIPGADENHQKDMTLFIGSCETLQRRFSCLVVGVHHSGKSGDMRGSTVLKGAGDFVFQTSKAEKAGGGVRQVDLICEKMKDAPDGWRDTYWLDSMLLGHTDASGAEMTSLVPRRAPKAERTAADQRRASRWARIVRTVLGERSPAPWSDLWKDVRDLADSEDLLKGTSKPRVTAEAAAHLGTLGADVDIGNGQTVHVHMVRERANGPWTVRQIVVETASNVAHAQNLGVLG